MQVVIHFTTVQSNEMKKRKKKSAELLSYKASFENKDSLMKAGEEYFEL
jgi:hypothetical protein